MISVALCTYNGEKFLDQQINSILKQSKPVNEIVICDDLSSDSTKDILTQFQIKFPSIINLHFNEHSLGVIKNFEKAIGLCKGNIIFLSDQDDLWKVEKVKTVLKRFYDSPDIEAVFTDGNLIDDNNKFLNNTLWKQFGFNLDEQKSWLNRNDALIDLIYHRNKITGATLAFKKSLFERAVPFPIYKGLWHDAWIGINASANGSLTWISQPLIDYRVHSYQQIGIGNGTTVGDGTTVNSTDFLMGTKKIFKDCLLIIDIIKNKYPDLEADKIKSEAIGWINFINLRLQLSNNIFLRIKQILKNFSIYNTHSRSVLKTILNDIFNPKKVSN